MAHQEQSQQSMQGQGSPHIPLDPSLNHLQYSSYYGNYTGQSQPQHHQPQPSHLPHHLSLPPNYSSPSSGGSDTIGTPPVEHMFPPSSSSGLNSKRPASSISNATASTSRKKVRRDEEEVDDQSPAADKDEKPKPTRGSRACTVCRRLKMKCVGAEKGGPCKRCATGNHECIFEESNRGKRSAKKHEALTRSVRKMEKTLDTVLKAMGNPSITSGLLSRTPSPSSSRDATTQALLASPSPPPSQSLPSHHSHTRSHTHHPPGSPKLHSLPDNALNPLGLLAEASLANRRSQASNPNGAAANNSRNDNPQVGVASDNYFKPGPMTILPLRRLYIERQIQPEMLSFVTTEEVVALFKLFFEHIHMHCGILDPNFHTPSLVCSRSPFLLTTICSIASKFYTAKPELHPRLTELAKKLAFSVPANGYKSVEIVQAYLLLALWGCGAVERYEQDKTWLLLGMAIRMGTDLNLHRKTATVSADTPEGRARDIEVHNRERTWILCFALDRSFSAQMGKPNTIKEDYIIRHADQWYQSPVAIPADASLVAYVELQRILSRSIDFLYSGTETVNGLQTNCDYLLVIKTFEAQLYGWQKQWANDLTFAGEPTPTVEYKRLISEFYFNYAMLVLNSFGLQNALERAPINIPHFFARCHTSAITCASIVRDELGPRGFIRYSPDSHFVQMSYAVLSLLKLIRPEFQAFLDDEQKTLQLVKDVADVLDDIAANPLHTPALYSGLLRALISAKLEPPSNGSGDGGLPDHGRPDENSMDDMSFNHNRMDTHGYSQHGVRGQPFHQPSSNSQHHSDNTNGDGVGFSLANEFQFDGEMGPVADMSTFPPTMAPPPNFEDNSTGLTMENFLGSGFWDSMLVPGYNSLDGFSGGFVFGAGGSGLITPRFGMSPMQSGTNTPGRHAYHQQATNQLTQHNINAAFKNKQMREGVGMKNDVSSSTAS